MSYTADVLRVFIASPGDVHEERLAVVDALSSWNNVFSLPLKTVLSPVRWETHVSPQINVVPQAAINVEALESCDILIAIFGTILGSPNGRYASGTAEEIEVFRGGLNKNAMLYFRKVTCGNDIVSQAELTRLIAYREERKRDSILKEYTSIPDLKQLVGDDLSRLILKKLDKPYHGRLVESQQPPISTPPEHYIQLENNLRIVERNGQHFLSDSLLGIERAITQTALWMPGSSEKPEYDPVTDVWTIKRSP